MEFLSNILGVLLLLALFVLVFGPKSFLKYFLYCRKMRNLYLKYIERGFDNHSALSKISKFRHPELSDTVHEKLASKFDDLGALIAFIYGGIEVHLLTKRELTDENVLALIEASKVVLDKGRYKVNIDRGRYKDILHYGKSPVDSKSGNS